MYKYLGMFYDNTRLGHHICVLDNPVSAHNNLIDHACTQIAHIRQ